MDNEGLNLHSGVITSISPTMEGLQFLTAFPREALLWADKNYYRSKSKDPWNRFVNLCKEWCNANGIKPLWKQMYDDRRMKGIPEHAVNLQGATRSYERGPNTLGHKIIDHQKGGIETDGFLSMSPSVEGETNIGGTRLRILSDGDADRRRHEMFAHEGAAAGVEKLARLIGVNDAEKFFARAVENLKYEEITDPIFKTRCRKCPSSRHAHEDHAAEFARLKTLPLPQIGSKY
jgi:hypothetical protein